MKKKTTALILEMSLNAELKLKNRRLPQMAANEQGLPQVGNLKNKS
jgi:hypothetical protein